MEVKMNARTIGKSLGVLLLGLVAIFVGYLLYAQVVLSRENVQIVPWKPTETSSITCYVVLKGPKNVLAMDCLERVEVPLEP